MNENQMSEKRLGELIDLLINGEISTEDFSELSIELERSAQSRSVFIETVSLHSDLKNKYRHHGDDVVESVALELELLVRQEQPDDKIFPSIGSTPMGTESDAFNQSRSSMFGLIAVCVPTVFSILLAGLSIWFIRSHDWQTSMAGFGIPATYKLTSAELEELDTAKTAVAVMIQDVNARWDSSGHGFKLGQSISPGMVELASGLVQIDFLCGATMILEGPAKFEIQDANTGFVHHGRLRVFVPERARGFTILSKQCEVVDLGTEFAMDVQLNDDAEIHVLQGEVWVRDLVSNDVEKQLLTGGKAVRFDGEVRAKNIKAETGLFVGPAEFNRRSKKAQNSGFARWRQNVDSLKQDPSLMAMFTFQESSEWDRLLVNSDPNSNGHGDGAIVGCNWGQGRWKLKRALDFASPSHRVRINVPGLHDAMTICSWVNLDNIDHDMALTHPETEQTNFIHWTLDSNAIGSVGSLHLAVTDTVDGVQIREHYNSGSACIGDADLKRWIHVAVTYDPVGKKVTHYKNGVEVGSQAIERVQRVGIGIANLGNWPYKKWSVGTAFEIRNLKGSMDEFSAFSRVLDAKEIDQIYQTGKPEDSF